MKHFYQTRTSTSHYSFRLRLVTFLFFFCCFASYAQQDFEWEWAKRGGGIEGLSSSYGNGDHYDYDEKVNSIAIDQQNNYYFAAEVGKTETNFDGTDFITYQSNNNNRDGYLVSTDCQGNFRWQKTIGGSKEDRIMKIATDESGGVYAMGHASNMVDDGVWSVQVHFDTDSIKPFGSGNSSNPVPNPANKGLFLVKYDTAGIFQWLVEPEDDNTSRASGNVMPMGMTVEPDGTSHIMATFGPGTHANNSFTVPEDGLQIAIVKYDSNGQFLGHVIVPAEIFPLNPYNGQFHYDRLNNQYYVSGFKTSSSAEFWFDGNEITGGMFLGAFDAQGNALWYHENVAPYANGGQIFDITTDEDSNVYITGKTFNFIEGGTESFAGYVFTQEAFENGTNAAFLIALDEDGNLGWGTNADSTCRYAAKAIAVNGDEVAIGLGLSSSDWAGVTYDRPTNHLNDPVVVRFDKQTGATIAIEDIMGTSGYDDEITALAVDNNGNYVAGGIIKNTLFTDHPNVPIMYNSGGPSDFFVAQLTHTDCTQTASVEENELSEVKVYPNPSEGIFNISGDGSLQISKIEIHSISGQKLIEQYSGESVDVSSLPQGMYFMEIMGADGTKVVKKLIKK